MSIKKQLKKLDFAALIPIWNKYCEDNNDYDSKVGCNENYEINEIFRGTEPIEMLRMAEDGDYHYLDDYYTFNEYGNLVTFNGHLDEDNCPIDIDEMADWLEDNPDIAEEYNFEVEEDEDDDE